MTVSYSLEDHQPQILLLGNLHQYPWDLFFLDSKQGFSQVIIMLIHSKLPCLSWFGDPQCSQSTRTLLNFKFQRVFRQIFLQVLQGEFLLRVISFDARESCKWCSSSRSVLTKFYLLVLLSYIFECSNSDDQLYPEFLKRSYQKSFKIALASHDQH